MKHFIKKTLERLPFLTGFNQIDGMPIKKQAELIAELLSECNRHKIPQDKKEQIILDGLNKTPDDNKSFRGLNVALLNRWFYAYKVSNQSAGIQPEVHPSYWEEKKKNDEFYKNQLAEIRRENPDYDPAKEMLNRIDNLSKVKSQKKHRPGKGSAEDVTYEEIK